MELQQLKYFLESAECENFSHTAERNFVPPSAVSISVKRLEEELGIKLFDRSANKIKLNKNGRLFAAAVRSAMNTLTAAKLKLAEEADGVSGEIHMLIRAERSLITEKIIAFRRLYPNVTFRLTHTFTKTDSADYDIIIDELSGNYEGFKQAPLITERIRVAASRTSPLAGRTLILSDLKSVDFITMSKGSSLYKLTERHCRAAGFEPHIVIESDDPLYIRRYISQNFGVAFFPEKSWAGEMGEDIVFLDIRDLDIMRTTYIYLNTVHKGTALSAFYRYLGESE